MFNTGQVHCKYKLNQNSGKGKLNSTQATINSTPNWVEVNHCKVQFRCIKVKHITTKSNTTHGGRIRCYKVKLITGNGSSTQATKYSGWPSYRKQVEACKLGQSKMNEHNATASRYTLMYIFVSRALFIPKFPYFRHLHQNSKALKHSF